MASTPIETWPTVRHRGRPGYSARPFAALAGTQDDPLRVAERLSMRAVGEDVHAESERRVAAGSLDRVAQMSWVSSEISRRNAAAWERLCRHFDAVIGILEHEVALRPTPAMRATLRQARAASRRAS